MSVKQGEKAAVSNRVFQRALAVLLTAVLAVSGIAVTAPGAYAAKYKLKKSATITVSQVQKLFNGKVGNGALGRQYHHWCLKFVAMQWFRKLHTDYYSDCCARKYGVLRRESASMDDIPIGADVFFTGSGTICGWCRKPAGHVGVYVGDGYMVHSMNGSIRREKVCDVDAVSNLTYYGWGFHEGVKVVPDKGDHPRGEVQLAEGDVGRVKVEGWALDDSASKKSVKVKVYIDSPAAGGEEHDVMADIKDAALNEELGVKGAHRFATTIKTKQQGKHTLFFYAENIGAGNDQLIGQQTVFIKAVPLDQQKASLKKVREKRQMLVASWTPMIGVKGYQVQVSTSKTFKKNVKTRWVKGAKTSKVRIKGLKTGSRYYVHVRAWKIKESKKVYSQWSSVKAIKMTW